MSRSPTYGRNSPRSTRFGVAILDRIRHACTEDTRFAGSAALSTPSLQSPPVAVADLLPSLDSTTGHFTTRIAGSAVTSTRALERSPSTCNSRLRPGDSSQRFRGLPANSGALAVTVVDLQFLRSPALSTPSLECPPIAVVDLQNSRPPRPTCRSAAPIEDAVCASHTTVTRTSIYRTRARLPSPKRACSSIPCKSKTQTSSTTPFGGREVWIWFYVTRLSTISIVVYLSDSGKDEFDVAELGRIDHRIRHANSRTRASRAGQTPAPRMRAIFLQPPNVEPRSGRSVSGACIAHTSTLTTSAYGANERGCRAQNITPSARERSTSTPGGGRRHVLCIGRDIRTRSDQYQQRRGIQSTATRLQRTAVETSEAGSGEDDTR
ncbi:hypothetical protein EXIGLDRAFT_748879 [Exidia glandulosa HHB12029]|uniref:Uncharacterized protein n=1 Tax=Exidia glandulosa HHB12029 TaxID=1314781 RepID=A0A165IXM3_EXIGL|nr:hypothetical protein EXIGLDRAFT_748879 [Exidia glandulosa HHB12029]